MINRSELLNDNEEAMREILDGRQSEIWSAMPGIVESVDFSKMTCTVQPTIQGVITDEDGNNSYTNLPLVPDCPICFPSAGGFTMTFPVAVGDEILLVFASRCIDAWWQQGGVQPPMEARMHDLSDAFVILAPKSQPKKISGISSSKVQLRKDDGTAYIELGGDGSVNIVAPGGVTITGALTATSVSAGGKDLATHIHTGGTLPPFGDTGPPA